jgi:hypothetical protein
MTYQLVPDVSDKAVIRIHPMVRAQLDKTLTKALDDMGYTKAYPQAPTFVVSYRVESAWDPRLSPEELRQRLGWSGGNFPDADPRSRDYQVLSLVIEFGSPEEKKLLWSGRADGIHYTPGGSGAELIEAAERILAEFPTAFAAPRV